MDNGECDLWSTHLPVLAACVANTEGPVLELGCGHYSTRLLHALCGPGLRPARRLVTCDTDPSWLRKFAHLRTSWHEMVARADVEPYTHAAWALIFVDEAPAGHRIGVIRALRQCGRLWVINNTEPPVTDGRKAYRYDEILPDFPHRFDYKRYPSTWTSVLSDVPLPSWLEGLV